MAEQVDDEEFARPHQAAPARLDRFVTADGRVRFPAPAVIATAIAA